MTIRRSFPAPTTGSSDSHLPHRMPFGFHGNWIPADH
jgi:hypothetical protein